MSEDKISIEFTKEQWEEVEQTCRFSSVGHRDQPGDRSVAYGAAEVIRKILDKHAKESNPREVPWIKVKREDQWCVQTCIGKCLGVAESEEDADFIVRSQYIDELVDKVDKFLDSVEKDLYLTKVKEYPELDDLLERIKQNG